MQKIEGSSRRKNSAKRGGISTAKIEKAIVQSMYMYGTVLHVVYKKY